MPFSFYAGVLRRSTARQPMDDERAGEARDANDAGRRREIQNVHQAPRASCRIAVFDFESSRRGRGGPLGSASRARAHATTPSKPRAPLRSDAPTTERDGGRRDGRAPAPRERLVARRAATPPRSTLADTRRRVPRGRARDAANAAAPRPRPPGGCRGDARSRAPPLGARAGADDGATEPAAKSDTSAATAKTTVLSPGRSCRTCRLGAHGGGRGTS